MVGVIVGDERARDAHAVGLRRVDELTHPVRRVDGERVARLPVADEVHEVDHLLGDQIVTREIAPREQLTEIQAVGHGPDPIRGG